MTESGTPDLTSNKSRASIAKDPKPLRFRMERQGTDRDYAVYRCEGLAGCNERVTTDAISQHASKQHDTFDYDVDTSIARTDR